MFTATADAVTAGRGHLSRMNRDAPYRSTRYLRPDEFPRLQVAAWDEHPGSSGEANGPAPRIPLSLGNGNPDQRSAEPCLMQQTAAVYAAFRPRDFDVSHSGLASAFTGVLAVPR
jgi:hypothetical protein